MGRDARNEDLDLTPAMKAKFDEFVALLAQQRYGEEGPPLETTFAEIEQFGHQAGRMLGRAVDTHLVAQHASQHFVGEQACPSCDEKFPPKESPHELPVQTVDGDVTLHEPTCNCSTCRRDFFPSASNAQD